MKDIHQYSRSEWNNSRHKWTESNLILQRPTVGYYIANKYAYIHYDTESFGYNHYDIFKKNSKAKDFIESGILKIIGNCSWKTYEGDWFSLDIKGLDPDDAQRISEEIYNFLNDFGRKFINN